MYRSLKYIAAAAISAQTVVGQDAADAVRYSMIDPTGTARYAGLGGAFGALGGDLTSLHTNPAGIAVFNKSTISISPTLHFNSTEATFGSTTLSDVRPNFNFGNLGAVLNINRKKNAEDRWTWKSFQFGVSYSRMASFQRQVTASNRATSSSYIDQLVNEANGSTSGLNPFSAGLGWETYLFEQGSDGQYFRQLLPAYGQMQRVNEATRGSMGEVAISFGGNYGNALYVGATIGIPRVDYQLDRYYSETDDLDTISNFSSFARQDYLKARGTGVNVKIGAIYRPNRWFRVGLAVHSPSYIEMDENYSANITSDVHNGHFYFASPEGSYSYSLTTPFRAIGSLAFVIKTFGLITAEYEFVDYTLAQLRAKDYSFAGENSNIKNQLHWGGNIRFGTEWRMKHFTLRGGMGLLSNPYTGEFDFSSSRYSLGAGLNFDHFFFDFTYLLQYQTGSYKIYDGVLASANSMGHSLIFTGGIKF